jgi:chromosomal replication initiation ATPase DnaA
MKTMDDRISEMTAKLMALGQPVRQTREDIQEVQAAVCAAFNLTFARLIHEGRTQRASNARWASFKICRDRTGATVNEIAEAHNLDRGTINHGLRQFEDKYTGDPEFRRGYERAVLALGAGERK